MEITRPIVGIENRTAQEVFDIMCERIRLSAAPVAVKVKPLEWVKTVETYRGSERRDQWRTETPWGAYIIWNYQFIDDEEKRGPKFTVGAHMTPFPPMEIEFNTLDEAKAAAQADYERRIKSAFVGVANDTE